jgi:hypothetical protein
MKKAVVATTAARGTAVSNSRITADQSVYMGAGAKRMPSSQSNRSIVMSPMPLTPVRAVLGSLLLLSMALLPAPAQAGIQFTNCQEGSDGSITCDTVPTGETLVDDESARYGLLNQASPGWSEFNPYEGYDEDFGGD